MTKPLSRILVVEDEPRVLREIVKVIFQTLLAPDEKLLLDRNCHKSVHHGVVLSGAHHRAGEGTAHADQFHRRVPRARTRRPAARGRAPRRLVRTPEIPAFTKLHYLPRDAYYCGGELVPVFDDKERVNRKLSNRVCADGIVPYPPGIPVLVPGQLITPKITELHGIVHEGYQPCVRVLKAGEEKNLRRIG